MTEREAREYMARMERTGWPTRLSSGHTIINATQEELDVLAAKWRASADIEKARYEREVANRPDYANRPTRSEIAYEAVALAGAKLADALAVLAAAKRR